MRVLILPRLQPARKLTHRQPVGRGRHAVQMQLPHVQILHCGRKALVTQQTADRQQIDTRFQQMSGEAVTQRVRSNRPVEARFLSRCLADFLDRADVDRLVNRLAGEQVLRRTFAFPVIAERLQESRRERYQTLFVAFGVLDS